MFDTLINQFWSLTFAGLALGFIYVLIAMGYTMEPSFGLVRRASFQMVRGRKTKCLS
jgi:branched-chain amino acid transport system permease protein